MGLIVKDYNLSKIYNNLSVREYEYVSYQITYAFSEQKAEGDPTRIRMGISVREEPSGVLSYFRNYESTKVRKYLRRYESTVLSKVRKYFRRKYESTFVLSYESTFESTKVVRKYNYGSILFPVRRQILVARCTTTLYCKGRPRPAQERSSLSRSASKVRRTHADCSESLSTRNLHVKVSTSCTKNECRQ